MDELLLDSGKWVEASFNDHCDDCGHYGRIWWSMEKSIYLCDECAIGYVTDGAATDILIKESLDQRSSEIWSTW